MLFVKKGTTCNHLSVSRIDTKGSAKGVKIAINKKMMKATVLTIFCIIILICSLSSCIDASAGNMTLFNVLAPFSTSMVWNEYASVVIT